MGTKVYLIPGMGTKCQVFDLLDLNGIEKVYLEHPEPMMGESLKGYSARMANSIPKDEIPILIGLSMGGIIAQEIASIRKVKLVILISSLRTGLKWILPLQLLRVSRLAYLFPANWTKRVIIFGIKQQGVPEKYKNDFLKMIRSFSSQYYKFAATELLKWKGCNFDAPIFQIHGNRDMVFPMNDNKVDHYLNGGHFIIVTKQNEISSIILEKCLKK